MDTTLDTTAAVAAPPLKKRPFFSPLNQRRITNFRHNRRGWWSFVLFMVMFRAQPVRRVHRQRQADPGGI